jgi:hypothetical protein
MRSSIVGVLVAVAACSTPDTMPADPGDCPPAPFTSEITTCPDHACRYDEPRGLSLHEPDFCNGLDCCDQGEASCRTTLVACSPHVLVPCPEGAASGAACVFHPHDDGGFGNAECVVPGSGADLDHGIVNGLDCACDYPGPVWRCIDVDRVRLVP